MIEFKTLRLKKPPLKRVVARRPSSTQLNTSLRHTYEVKTILSNIQIGYTNNADLSYVHVREKPKETRNGRQ